MLNRPGPTKLEYPGDLLNWDRPMRLFVLGATGRTGRRVIEEALARGHIATAVVRKSGSVKPRPNLRIAVADPTSAGDLARVLPGHDAVISCIGQRSGADAGILERVAAAMLEAMPRSGVRRCLVVSQGLLFPSRNPAVALFRFLLRRHVADSEAMERLVEASDSDWTIVRPPRLLEGGVPHGYRAQAGGLPAGAWSIQYADLAKFLVDAAESREYLNNIVGVGSANAEEASELSPDARVPAMSGPNARADGH